MKRVRFESRAAVASRAILLLIAVLLLWCADGRSCFAGWSQPRQVNSDANADGTSDGGSEPNAIVSDVAPAAAAGPDGVLVACWLRFGSKKICYSRSTNGGKTWSEFSQFPTVDSFISEPRIGTDGLGTWVIVWSNGQLLQFSRSVDNGVTWSAPQLVGSSYPDGLLAPSAIVADGGTWIVGVAVNASVSVPDYQYISKAYCCRSTDGGASWGPLQPLNSYPAAMGDVDYGPQFAADGEGHWVAAWPAATIFMIPTPSGPKTPVETQHYIRSSRSSDDGETFTLPLLVDSGGLRGGGTVRELAVGNNRNGTWLLVRSKRNLNEDGIQSALVYHVSTDNGSTWTAPAAVDPHFAADLVADDEPVLEHDEQGNWLLGWYRGNRYELSNAPVKDYDLMYATAKADKAVWSVPKVLNRNAKKDAGDDITPVLVRTRGSHFDAVWSSYNTQDSKSTADEDIWSARGTVKFPKR